MGFIPGCFTTFGLGHLVPLALGNPQDGACLGRCVGREPVGDGSFLWGFPEALLGRQGFGQPDTVRLTMLGLRLLSLRAWSFLDRGALILAPLGLAFLFRGVLD